MKRVRQADARDAEQIAHVHVATWQKAYRGIIPDSFLDGLSVTKREEFWNSQLKEAPGRTLVAEADIGVIGFADFGPSRDGDAVLKTGELNAIYVLPGHWGQGQGSALMVESEKALRAAGFARITLWVLEGNQRGRDFYERHGFRFEGTAKPITFSGSALTELRYRKDMTKP
jgi:ribosomal protein S18 acetylase RimI-like enzyme